MTDKTNVDVSGHNGRVVSLKAYTHDAASMRAVALELAIVASRKLGVNHSDEAVLARAEAYFAFLTKGGDEAANSDTERSLVIGRV